MRAGACSRANHRTSAPQDRCNPDTASRVIAYPHTGADRANNADEYAYGHADASDEHTGAHCDPKATLGDPNSDAGPGRAVRIPGGERG